MAGSFHHCEDSLVSDPLNVLKQSMLLDLLNGLMLIELSLSYGYLPIFTLKVDPEDFVMDIIFASLEHCVRINHNCAQNVFSKKDIYKMFGISRYQRAA